ncbi:MAG: branched-chain amino acid aminotransferase [bacterium]
MKVIQSNNLKTKPSDENNLGFGDIFTDYMLIKQFKDDKWQETELVPYAPISLDPSAPCLHYGQEVFEGMRAYRNAQDDVMLFRPEENFKRLNLSNKRIGIPELDEQEALEELIEFLKIERDWIPKSLGTSVYIRPFLFANGRGLGLKRAKEYTYMVILAVCGPYSKKGSNPVNIYVESNYVRAVKGGTGMAKTGGNYAGSLVVQEEAGKKGFDQVLWLDAKEHKYIEEVGAMNVMFVIKDDNDKTKVITPALTGSILDGITRKSTIELIKSLGYEVEEKLISIDEIAELQEKGNLLEAFGTGTAVVILPIGNLHYKNKDIAINNGRVGDLTDRIYTTLTDIQYGRSEDKFGWTKRF